MSQPIVLTNGQHEIKIYTVQNRGRSVFQLSYYEGGHRQRQTCGKLADARREAVTTDRSLRKSDFRSRFDVLTFATLPIPLSVIGDEVFVQRETRFSDLPGEIPAGFKAVARKKLG